MYNNISYYQSSIIEANRKLKELNEDLDGLGMMKREVSKGENLTMEQITNKRKAAGKILDNRNRLPLVDSLNDKLQSSFEGRIVQIVERNFDSVTYEVDNAITKVKNEISKQNTVIKNCNEAIKQIQEEERREAARRAAEEERARAEQQAKEAARQSASQSRVSNRASYR